MTLAAPGILEARTRLLPLSDLGLGGFLRLILLFGEAEVASV